MDHSSLNNSSLRSADGATHVKIVAVALVAGMMVIGVGIAARTNIDLIDRARTPALRRRVR